MVLREVKTNVNDVVNPLKEFLYLPEHPTCRAINARHEERI
jgi:hypothetical protein